MVRGGDADEMNGAKREERTKRASVSVCGVERAETRTENPLSRLENGTET